jgi:hypothetical protein
LKEFPSYRAPAWLPGGHAQTIWPIVRKGAPPAYRRERWETPDGDFIDVDWLAAPHDAGAPLVVLFHGLEGSSGGQWFVEPRLAHRFRPGHSFGQYRANVEIGQVALDAGGELRFGDRQAREQAPQCRVFEQFRRGRQTAIAHRSLAPQRERGNEQLAQGNDAVGPGLHRSNRAEACAERV